MSSALSAASSACDHMRDWIHGTPSGTFVSMGVFSDGSYNAPKVTTRNLWGSVRIPSAFQHEGVRELCYEHTCTRLGVTGRLMDAHHTVSVLPWDHSHADCMHCQTWMLPCCTAALHSNGLHLEFHL